MSLVVTLGCPACGGEVRRLTWSEPALLVHGGYGATRTTTTVSCRACDWWVTESVRSERPLETTKPPSPVGRRKTRTGKGGDASP